MINPLEHYEIFSNRFAELMIRLKRNGNIINEETAAYVQFISISPMWLDIGLKALNEIKKMLYEHNSERAYNLIISDYENFSKWIEDVKNSNPLIEETINKFEEQNPQIAKTGEINGDLILICQRKEEDNNSKIMLSYAKIINAFHVFYNPIIDFTKKKSTIHIEKDDVRINSGANEKEISDYFKVLTRKNKNGEQILDKDDLDILLRSNFIGFKVCNRKFITPNCNKADIRHLVYIFYQKYIKLGGPTADRYTDLLINNFTDFKNSNHSKIIKEWSKRPAKYPFD